MALLDDWLNALPITGAKKPKRIAKPGAMADKARKNAPDATPNLKTDTAVQSILQAAQRLYKTR